MNYEEVFKRYKDDIVNDTCELIKIKSVEDEQEEGMPFGKGVGDALNFTLNLCENLGFKTKNLDGYAGYAEVGEGEEMIGILVHVDVVESGSGWKHPPFSGTIYNNRIYGRGAIDNKGPTIAVIYALKILKDLGFKFNKKVRIIFGANEETSWKCIRYYIKNETIPKMSFTPDANFPVIQGEKGILGFTLTKKLEGDDKDILIKEIKGGTYANVVPDKCIAKLDLSNTLKKKILEKIKEDKKLSFEIAEDEINIISSGKSAHASQPEKGVNAISIMMDFLGKTLQGSSPINEFISQYNQIIGLDYNGQNFVGNYEDSFSGKLTLNVGKINVSKDKAEIVIDVRYPIKSTYEEIKASILSCIRKYEWEYNEDEHFAPIFFESNHNLIKTLMEVYKRQTGDINSKPIIIGGGTYARAMKNTVAFGPVFPSEKELAHQSNEYISIDKLHQITKIYYEAIKELCK